MISYCGEKIIQQLEKQKGGYFYLKIDAEVINQLKNKSKTRIICTLDEKVSFQCGLNHLGDGNFFIILSKKNLQLAEKTLGSTVSFTLEEDPNPLGVDMPEVMEAIFDQDQILKAAFERLTDGKKRSIVYTILKIKDVDKQIQKTIELIDLVSNAQNR
jgi:Domain of unknown function (DUF1905)/Bacteriocin-protection, YdeI or OmpD-Associated